MAVEEKVKQIIVEQLQVDEAEVTPGASFQEDLGADSLDVVELVMQFEEAFDIQIPDEDAEKIKTVKDAVDYIEKNQKAAKEQGSSVASSSPASAWSAVSGKLRRRSGKGSSPAAAVWRRSRPLTSPATPSVSRPRSKTSTRSSSSTKKRPARWAASSTSPSPPPTRP